MGPQGPFFRSVHVSSVELYGTMPRAYTATRSLTHGRSVVPTYRMNYRPEVRRIVALAQEIKREEREANARKRGRPAEIDWSGGVPAWDIPLDHHPDWYLEEAARRLGYRIVHDESFTLPGGFGRPPSPRKGVLRWFMEALFGK